MDAAAAKPGLAGRLRRMALGASAALAFARLYMLPARRNALPEQIRLEPVW